MHVGDQEGRVGIPLTSLTLPYFCACPEPGQGFPMSYVMGFLCSGNYGERLLFVLLILVELLTITD
jgi:hypothetical protein